MHRATKQGYSAQCHVMRLGMSGCRELPTGQFATAASIRRRSKGEVFTGTVISKSRLPMPCLPSPHAALIQMPVVSKPFFAPVWAIMLSIHEATTAARASPGLGSSPKPPSEADTSVHRLAWDGEWNSVRQRMPPSCVVMDVSFMPHSTACGFSLSIQLLIPTRATGGDHIANTQRQMLIIKTIGKHSAYPRGKE